MVIVLNFVYLKSMNLLESRLPMEKLQALLSERFQIVFSDSSLLDTAFLRTPLMPMSTAS